jgi:hypothetical protein
MAQVKTEWNKCTRCSGTGSLRSANAALSPVGEHESTVECELCSGTGMVASTRVRPGFAAGCLMTMFVISLITYFSPEVGAASVVLVLAVGYWAMATARRI